MKENLSSSKHNYYCASLRDRNKKLLVVKGEIRSRWESIVMTVQEEADVNIIDFGVVSKYGRHFAFKRLKNGKAAGRNEITPGIINKSKNIVE